MDKQQISYLLFKIDTLENRIKQLENKQSLEEYFTVQEVSQSLKVTPLTIQRKIHENKIKAISIGKEYRISKEAFNEYILSLSNE